MLELAAVAGRHIDSTLLQELTGRPETELIQVMESLIAAQLIVETSADQYAFRHALTQQAVYAGLLTHKRKLLHLTIGQTMEHLYNSTLEMHLSDLAYHFYQAQAWPKALEYGQRIGAKAIALYSPQAAVEHFTQALEAASHLPEVNPIPLYRARAKMYQLLSDFEGARSDFEQVVAVARLKQDHQAEWQGLVALGYAWTERDYSHVGDFFTRALDLAQALDDPGKYAFSQNHLANWLINVGQPAKAIMMLEESLESFQQQGNMRSVARTLQFLGAAASFYGDRQLSLSSLDRAISLLQTSGDKWVYVVCLVLRTYVASPALTESIFSVQSSLSVCQQDLEEALRVADSIEWRTGRAFAQYMAGWMFASFGELGAALSSARTALEIALEVENRQYIVGS